MPRKPRVQFPDAVYHVMANGITSQPLFVDDRDRSRFLGLVASVVRRHDWQCHAYCLLTTHYHLLVRTPDGDIARGMHWLNGVYAKSFNKRHGGRGHVFRDRYHTVLVENDVQLVVLVRYISLNAVEAGICRDPADWPWSSFPALTKRVEAPTFLAREWIVTMFGERDGHIRLDEFVRGLPATG